MFVPFLAVLFGGAIASGLIVLDTPPRIDHTVVAARVAPSDSNFNH